VQTDALGTLISLEIARNGIGDHYIQFSERISLGCDTTSTWGIPARYVTAGGRAGFNVKDNFSLTAHIEKIRGLDNAVNKRTSRASQKKHLFSINALWPRQNPIKPQRIRRQGGIGVRIHPKLNRLCQSQIRQRDPRVGIR
jgi:hypothetical protein